MKKWWIYVCFLAWSALPAQAATITDSLYLNSGYSLMPDSQQVYGYAFNRSPQYSAHNAVLQCPPGDSLRLYIYNSDSLNRQFSLEGHLSTPLPLLAGQWQSLTIEIPNQGIFLYEETSSSPQFRYLGASGMLVVDNSQPAGTFYWNIHEWQSEWNDSLQNGQNIQWSNYQPDYFLLNGRGKPQIVNDSSAVIRGTVGDTLRIYVMNTGRGLHSLHFHGYHVRIVRSTRHPERNNWIKDTVPLDSREGAIFELIPDKPGMYPVHDHNLIAVSGGGYYPNGIFLVMDIQ